MWDPRLRRYPVTVEEFGRFVRDEGYSHENRWKAGGFGQRKEPAGWDEQVLHPNQPVVGVSWFEAAAFCAWAGVRLPTEAEWERAARGGVEQKQFPWGDDPPQSQPDYALRWQSGPEPTGRSVPSAFGLYDIGDNVHEWCSDWYDPNYYAVSPERNARGPEQCPMKPARKSSRGGSWRHHIKVARCSQNV